jgi:uncharacterized protein YndB with AHSA1/START domain
MKSVVTTMTINAPSERVWDIIAKGSDLERWFSAIETCELEGPASPGTKRICKTFQGHVLKETILSVDNTAMVFQYFIDEQDMLPTKDVLGTIHVTTVSPTQTNITWLANYKLLDEGMEDAVAMGLDQLYQGGIKGIEELIKKQLK